MIVGSSIDRPKSILTIGALATMLVLSACQQQSEPESSMEEGVSADQSVPMSAEPAEPNDMVVADEVDASVDAVADDTVAMVNDEAIQKSYLCSPTLEVNATYLLEDKQMILEAANQTLTLMRTDDGSNPTEYKVDSALDGSEGYTQWRTAHEEFSTGVLRTADAAETTINTYECNEAS